VADFIFYFIALCGCVSAFMTVTARDIFHSAVWLALTLLSVSGFYFYIGAEFLGAVQILVYVGGIVTLFIYAIKLTADIGDKTIKQTNEQKGISFFISALIFAVLVFSIMKTPFLNIALSVVVSTAQIGRVLLTDYVLAFEILSFVLLIALMGAIIIARKEVK